MKHFRVMTLCLAACLGLGVDNAEAQDKAKEPPKLGWSNDADLSLVLTAGNSASQTWAFTDELRHAWKDARFEFEVNVVRANTSDDRFLILSSGGSKLVVGSADARKAKLDTICKTALVLKF
jgi:hypothetical protein